VDRVLEVRGRLWKLGVVAVSISRQSSNSRGRQISRKVAAPASVVHVSRPCH
jgi:hypothetical protein